MNITQSAGNCNVLHAARAGSHTEFCHPNGLFELIEWQNFTTNKRTASLLLGSRVLPNTSSLGSFVVHPVGGCSWLKRLDSNSI
jgi:hypothetical protein